MKILLKVIALGFVAFVAFGVYHDLNLTPAQRAARNAENEREWKATSDRLEAERIKKEEDDKDVNEIIDSVRGSKSREEWKEDKARRLIEKNKRLYGPHWND